LTLHPAPSSSSLVTSVFNDLEAGCGATTIQGDIYSSFVTSFGLAQCVDSKEIYAMVSLSSGPLCSFFSNAVPTGVPLSEVELGSLPQGYISF
jgi:hypothetical protein